MTRAHAVGTSSIRDVVDLTGEHWVWDSFTGIFEHKIPLSFSLAEEAHGHGSGYLVSRCINGRIGRDLQDTFMIPISHFPSLLLQDKFKVCQIIQGELGLKWLKGLDDIIV